MEIIKNLIEENLKLKDEIEQLNKALEQSRQSLENCRQDHNNVSSRIIAAQENERKQISFDLHDVLGKSLTAIKFSVEHVLMSMTRWGNRESRSQLENVVAMIQETIKETRDLTTSLWPPVLTDLGIVATISWYSREFEKIYPWVFVSRKIGAQESQIPDDIKIVIFRILQEAMNNSIKHSGCKNIEIILEQITNTSSEKTAPTSSYENSSLENIDNKTGGINKVRFISGTRFVVSDDGKGFTPPRNNNDSYSLCSIKSLKEGDNCSKFGLVSMKERCRLSGGTLEIESATGKGTVIRALWLENNINLHQPAESNCQVK